MLVTSGPTWTPAKPVTRRSEDLAAAFLLPTSDTPGVAYANDLREWFPTWCADHDLDPLDATRVT